MTTSTNPQEPARYVISPNGEHAAHPSEILASCKALESHLTKARDEARATIHGWDEGIRERDLEEKRRVAPGWLDREEKLLKPTVTNNKNSTTAQLQETASLLDSGPVDQRVPSMKPRDEGEELDRAFGGLDVK